MSLETLKAETLKLLQEYMEDEDNLTDDEDIAYNMIPAINKILFELARIKKIQTYEKRTVKADETLDLTELSNFYQLKLIRFSANEETSEFDYTDNFEIVGNYVTFNKAGTATIYYYRYPELITEDTEDEHTLELSLDALNIAPTGIAGTILMTDISNQYGAVFLNKYEQMIARLDSRTSDNIITFTGGM